jgi:NDP-sugar pyrophosphorylase family protein
MSPLVIAEFVASFAQPMFAPWAKYSPWDLTSHAEVVVRALLEGLSEREFAISNGIAVHRSAIVEANATLKGPLVVGAGCFVASGAYLRGGNWLAEGCTVGPGTELKSSFVFANTKLAHFNFVGDSVLGEDVNLEAGSVICNYRNERTDKEVMFVLASGTQPTGVEKFGALVGDGCRLGANSVVAPGALLRPGVVVHRASLIDQEQEPGMHEASNLPSTSRRQT